jgi:hypothetical protein
MATARKAYKNKPAKQGTRTGKVVLSTVITVRLSNEEKERMEQIMMNLDITRYTDVMRMALHMITPSLDIIR